MNRIRRQLLDRVDLNGRTITILDMESLNHLQVLRLRPDEEIEVIDPEENALHRCRCRNSALRGVREFVMELLESRSLRPESICIDLYQGIPKGSKMDSIVRQTTEIGVSRIIPLIMKRCVAENKKCDRFRRIAEEASLQSKRESIPLIEEATTLAAAIDVMKESDLVLLFDEETTMPLRPILSTFRENMSRSMRPTRIALIIGPEGGIDRDEVALLRDRLGESLAVVSLGSHILRTETAGISAISKILYEMEETV